MMGLISKPFYTQDAVTMVTSSKLLHYVWGSYNPVHCNWTPTTLTIFCTGSLPPRPCQPTELFAGEVKHHNVIMNGSEGTGNNNMKRHQNEKRQEAAVSNSCAL